MKVEEMIEDEIAELLMWTFGTWFAKIIVIPRWEMLI